MGVFRLTKWYLDCVADDLPPHLRGIRRAHGRRLNRLRVRQRPLARDAGRRAGARGTRVRWVSTAGSLAASSPSVRWRCWA